MAIHMVLYAHDETPDGRPTGREREEKKMTRKQLIAACVDDQIKRGVIKAESREKHIKMRLNGAYAMSKAKCEQWYKEVFGA